MSAKYFIKREFLRNKNNLIIEGKYKFNMKLNSFYLTKLKIINLIMTIEFLESLVILS